MPSRVLKMFALFVINIFNRNWKWGHISKKSYNAVLLCPISCFIVQNFNLSNLNFICFNTHLGGDFGRLDVVIKLRVYSFLSFYRGKKPIDLRYVRGKVQVSFYFQSWQVAGCQNNTIYDSFDRMNTNFWSELVHRTMKIVIVLRVDYLHSALKTVFV